MTRLIEQIILQDLKDIFNITNPVVEDLPIDIIETAEGYQVYVDIPGVKKEDITVEIEKGRILRISVERKSNETEGRYMLKERPSGKFSKVVKLPTSVDSGKIKGKYENGVLSFFLFKDKKDRIEVEIE